MASVSLNEVLGAPQLTGLYETVKTGIPDVFPADFYRVDKKVHGNKASFFQAQGQRQVAPETEYGSESRSTDLKNLTEVPVVLGHTFNNLAIPLAPLMSLIKPTSDGSNLQIDEMGVDEIMRHVRNAVETIDNRRVFMLSMALAKGTLYFDAQGNPLPTSSGAKTSVDFQVPAENKDQLSGLIGTSWATDTADIEDQLIALDQRAMDDTGYELRYAFYGRNIPKYLSSNSKMAAYLARNAAANNDYTTKGRITELGNLNWQPGYRSSYRDTSGTTQRIVGDDQVIFSPTPDLSWLGWIEGSYPVPQSIDISDNMQSKMGQFKETYGKFMWAETKTDAPGIKLLYGDTTLPCLRVPKAIYIATVAGF